MNNSIGGAQYGVSVAAYDWLYTTMDVFADNNKVINNSITCENEEGDTGIFVGVANGPGNYKASADNNKVIHNVIEGYETPIDEGGNTATKVHANVVEP